MKILAIRLKNLTSIEGSVEIDFTKEPLKSSGLFAISGATGAGKSTILDALCLSLYAKVPRFAKGADNMDSSDVADKSIKQNDVRNLLRRGTGEGYAEVDFVAVDGKIYRSRWSVKRANNKPTGNIQSYSMSVVCLSDNSDVQGTRSEILDQIEQLVGLNYEQFTRTVLLAQNDFATFLKSKGDEKGDLLEKLTGTEIYSLISMNVYRKTKDMQEKRSEIENKMQAIEIIADEELNTLEKSLKEIEVKNVEVNKNIDRLTKEANVVKEINLITTKLQEKIKEEQTKVSETETVNKSLQEQTERKQKFEDWLKDKEPELTKVRNISMTIVEKDSTLKNIEKNNAERSLFVKQKDREIAILTKSKDDAKAHVSDIIGIPKNELYIADVQTIYTQLSNDIEFETKVNTVCYDEITRLSDMELEKESGRLNTLIVKWQEQTNKKNTLKEKKEQADRLKEELTSLAQMVAERKSIYEDATKNAELLRTLSNKDVSALRNRLEENKPCAVCGSTHHPFANKQKELEDKYIESEKLLEDARNKYEEARKKYDTESAKYNLLSEEKIKLTAEIEQNEKELSLVDNKENIISKLEHINKEIERLKNLTKEYGIKTKATQQKTEKHKILDRCINIFETAEKQIAEKAEERNKAQQLIDKDLTIIEELRKDIHSLRQQISEITKGKTIEEVEAHIKHTQKDIVDSIDKVKAEAEKYNNQLAAIRGELKVMNTSMKELEHLYKHIERPDLLPTLISEAQQAKAENDQYIGTIKERLRKNAENAKLVGTLKTEHEKIKAKTEKWEKLNSLIGSHDGKKFKIIAQGYTLNILLHHANKHLSYLSKRYKLRQIQNTLGLEVIDCDMCNEVRTVYSLSGGETFLISLALALGLSSLSSKNLKVESLFIDEGFGSLDSETLQVAMQALEQLQLQGRKIGVISHIQEMREQITTQIHIDKTHSGKSAIRIIG